MLTIHYLFLFVTFGAALKWYEEKLDHGISTLTDQDLKFVSSLSNENSNMFNQTLFKIAIPRPVFSVGHLFVQMYIKKAMEELGWEVTEDEFVENTPYGEIPFNNIIATLDPKAQRHLVLACHYDSKLNREKTLVVATDSAVACSMMINLAQLLDPYLKNRQTHTNVSLRFIFFDGEEALEHWTNTDSLYGSRHLADFMETQSYPHTNEDGTNTLNRMDALVLLDLLGEKDPTIPIYFMNTRNLYYKLASAETRLYNLKQLINHSKNYFDSTFGYGISDDHLPFLNKGVRILHIIPSPFPKVWHQESDTVENLDFSTIENLNKIFRVFVSEYLHISLNIN